MRNQRNRAGLGLAQQHEQPQDQQDIRDAFVGMAKHLRSRASVGEAHVSPFNEAGGQRQTPGWALIRAARACLDAATERGGDAPTMTVTEVALYFDTLKTVALRGYEPTTCSAELAVVEFAREASEAQAAVTRLAVERSPSAAMEARKEVLELIPAAERVVRIHRHLPSHPLPMGAVR
jgi:hypothetical protein